MPWTTSDTLMDLRSKHPSIEIGVDTLDGWRRHLSGRNASVLAFFGFVSIFPLLLAATTILGFVLQDNEELQQRIIDGALADIPVLGQQLQNDPTSLNGSVWALVIGLAGALWGATKAFAALQAALDDVWEVEVDHRASLPAQRAKALLGILIIGGAQIASIALATLVNAAGLPNAGRVVLTLANVAVNIGVFGSDVPLPHGRLADLARRVAGGGHRRSAVHPVAVLRHRHHPSDHRELQRHLRPVRASCSG